METTNTDNAATTHKVQVNGYNRNEKMARIAKLVTENNIEFSGEFSKSGNELIAWECRSDWGEKGWMVGEFCYYEVGPWLPMLSCEVFFSTKAQAMAEMERLREGGKYGGKYSPRR